MHITQNGRYMIGKEGYRYGREKSNKERKKIEKHLENGKMVAESE